jgi:hypothetical protein
MNDTDRYYELLQQLEAARSQGRYPQALALSLEALQCLPALVRWCIKEVGRWDIPAVPPIAYACQYLAALQRRDEIERVRALIASIPQLSDWLEEIDGAFEGADLMSRVEQHLRQHPGSLQKNMGRELGVDGRDVSNLLLYARQIGVIRREAEGKTYRLYFQESPLATANLHGIHPVSGAQQSSTGSRPSGCAIAFLVVLANGLQGILGK